MSNLTAKSKLRPSLSVKAQTAATVCAIIGALALPQVFHIMGSVSGLGTALGEAFLPMHISIILVGLLAGPFAGAVSGALSPLISFALTGMPKIGMLPFMMIELCIYGLASGLLRQSKMPAVLKVLIAQTAGRAVRAGVILIAYYVLGQTGVPVSVIWTSISAGIFGIALQLTLIPLIVYRVENRKSDER